jgi:hypothetical protein
VNEGTLRRTGFYLIAPLDEFASRLMSVVAVFDNNDA